MTVSGEEKIRGMIRLIPPARALKQDLEKALHMDMYSGAGDMAVKSYRGLRDSVATLTDDPFLDALAIDVSPESTDKEKTALVVLMAGQLLAYLEGQTGMAAAGGGGNYHFSVQSAPNLNGNNISVSSKEFDRLLGGKGESQDDEEGDGEEG